MSRLHKSNEGFSDIFTSPGSSFSEHTPELKKDIVKESKRDDSWKDPEAQKPMRRNAGESVGRGDIDNNDIHSNKFMGSESSNSIWNSGTISDIAKAASNDEKTAMEKADIQRAKAGWKENTMAELAEGIQSADTRKAAGVYSTSTQESGRKSLTRNAISMFDDQSAEAFARVPEKTAGEIIRDEARAEKEVDNTWRGMKPSQKAKSSLFDSFLDME